MSLLEMPIEKCGRSFKWRFRVINRVSGAVTAILDVVELDGDARFLKVGEKEFTLVEGCGRIVVTTHQKHRNGRRRLSDWSFEPVSHSVVWGLRCSVTQENLAHRD